MTSPELSVIIPAYNEEALIVSTLDCLHNYLSARPETFEIIVVDNASVTNDTRVVAEAFNVRYIREDRPGLDIARNTGARAARGSIVAYTDGYWEDRVAWTR